MWLRGAVPAYVSAVSDQQITVGGAWFQAPTCTCLATPHIPNAAGCLPPAPTDPEIVATLNCLVARGFMLMDFDHSWPPVAVADSLRARGFDILPFRTLTFDGKYFRVVVSAEKLRE